jgi:hypothetical protein
LLADQGEIFPDHGGGGEGGDLGDIVGGRDFHHIHAGKMHGAEAAQDRLHLPAGESADFRRAGARRESRIEAIDIEGQIGQRVADNPGDALAYLRCATACGPNSWTSCAVTMVTPLSSVQS